MKVKVNEKRRAKVDWLPLKKKKKKRQNYREKGMPLESPGVEMG